MAIFNIPCYFKRGRALLTVLCSTNLEGAKDETCVGYGGVCAYCVSCGDMSACCVFLWMTPHNGLISVLSIHGSRNLNYNRLGVA